MTTKKKKKYCWVVIDGYLTGVFTTERKADIYSLEIQREMKPLAQIIRVEVK